MSQLHPGPTSRAGKRYSDEQVGFVLEAYRQGLLSRNETREQNAMGKPDPRPRAGLPEWRMWVAFRLATTAACSAPVPDPTSLGTRGSTIGETAPPIAPWITYSNEGLRLAFDHPKEIRVVVETEGPFQILVYTDRQNPFYVRATREYLPGDVVYLLDSPSTGLRKYGEYTWEVFELPNGYGDAIGVTPPIFALQMEAGDVLYSLLFYDQGTTTELQDRIVSTFRVLD